MFKVIKAVFLSAIILFAITGCTHKIDMGPNVDKVTDSVIDIKKRDYNVAYTIRSYDQNKYVVTPGGGGDKIGYTPYNDTESVLRSVLSKAFNKVYKVDINDKEYIAKKDIRFIFTYNIQTDSSSQSLLTWPPTKFKIDLTCKAIDSKGNNVWQENIVKEGDATFSEFKSNFSLAAQRASEKVFSELLEKINESKIF